MLSSAFALASALAFGGPLIAPLSELSLGVYEPGPAGAPDLTLHLPAAGGAEAAPVVLDVSPRRRTIAGLPVCSGDLCQASVSVPGFDPSYGSSKSARADAFAALLSRTRVEPLATVGRALVVTGVRVDYSPSFFEPSGTGAHGWGNLQLRVRLRLDADNGVVIPAVP